MKKKSIFGAALALAIMGGALTACSTTNATSPIMLYSAQPAIAYSTVATQRTASDHNLANVKGQLGNFTVLEAPWQTDEVPASAMSPEEAAAIAESYIYDVFGKSIDGMYVMMSYSDCWQRPDAGRWIGLVSLTQPNTTRDTYAISPGPDDTIFTFTVDSVTGQRLEISYRPLGSPPIVIEHDTQPLWESPTGQAVQAMDDNELVDFIGITASQMDAYMQDVYEFARAHFANATVKNIALGRTVSTPTGLMHLSGLNVLLDTDANGNVFGTYVGIEFTVTAHDGREVIVTLTEWHQGYRTVQLWTPFIVENTTEETQVYRQIAPRNIPEEYREMWEADDAEVYRLRGLIVRGPNVSPDDFPPYALRTRAEMLDVIGRVVDIEARHYAMSREELVTRVTIAQVMVRLHRFDTVEDAFHYSFFDWVRENYTEENIAVYVEMGAPQWLIDRLMEEIA